MKTIRCSSTGYSAAYLTFGRELRTPDDITTDLRGIIQSENFLPEITPRLLQLADTLHKARETHEHQQEIRKQATDTHRHDPGYQPGDLVWVTTHTLSKAKQKFSSKLAPRRDGPYTVLRQVGNTTYEIASQDDPTTPLGTYHTSLLTPYQAEQAQEERPMHPIKKRGRPKKKQL